jgi:hypothetical protein
MRARLVSFLMVLALAGSAFAADRRSEKPLSLDRVLPQIRHAKPGRFYDAEGPFMSPGGQASYRIKWMTPDGRITWFTVDAHSGQILGGPPPSYAPRERDDDRGYDRRDTPDPRNNFGDNDGPGRGSQWNRDDRYRDDRGRDSRPEPDRNWGRQPDRNWNREDQQDRNWNRDDQKRDDRNWNRDSSRSGGSQYDRGGDRGRESDRNRGRRK